MGLFSGGRSWAEEYDRRLEDARVKKDVMKSWRVCGRETRVADDKGVMRRRNGEVCCGCGKGNYGGRDQDRYHEFDLDKPAYDHHAHHDAEEPPRRRFLGIF
jgi:hypothetical protein